MSSNISVISNAKHKIFPQKIIKLLYGDSYIFHKKVGSFQQYFYVKDGEKTELGDLEAEGKNYKVFYTPMALSLLKDGQLKTLASGRIESFALNDRYMVYNCLERNKETDDTPIGPWFLVDFETEEVIKTDLARGKAYGTDGGPKYYENYQNTGRNIAQFDPRGRGETNFMEIPSGKIFSVQEMSQLVRLAKVAKDPSYRG